MFVGSLPAPAQSVCDYLVGNFHHNVCAPGRLGEYDLVHSLERTPFASVGDGP